MYFVLVPKGEICGSVLPSLIKGHTRTAKTGQLKDNLQRNHSSGALLITRLCGYRSDRAQLQRFLY
jgi:hypothetical protein